MSPTIALMLMIASVAGLIVARREALALRRSLVALQAEVGGTIGGGLITYPGLRFDLDGSSAWLGGVVGGFGVDGGGSGPVTMCRVELESESRSRRWEGTDLLELAPAATRFPPSRLSARVDGGSLTVQLDGLPAELADCRAIIEIAATLAAMS